MVTITNLVSKDPGHQKVLHVAGDKTSLHPLPPLEEKVEDVIML